MAKPVLNRTPLKIWTKALVFKPCSLPSYSMSRPQFPQGNNNQQQLLAPVVNGGLIDFQDNFNRGMCEYPNPQQLMAAAYGYQQAQGMMAPNQATAISALCQHYQQQGVAAGFPSPNPSNLAAHPVVNGTPAGLASVPAAAPGGSMVGTTATLPGTYISGPPTFLHVNGITYKPVEETPVPAGSTASASTKSASQEGETERVGTKMLTEKDLHRAIDQRVQSKVESYMSTRRYPATASSTLESHGDDSGDRISVYHPRSSTSPHRSSGRSSGSSNSLMEAEQRAAARVHNVNASMKSHQTRERSRDPGAAFKDW